MTIEEAKKLCESKTQEEINEICARFNNQEFEGPASLAPYRNLLIPSPFAKIIRELLCKR